MTDYRVAFGGYLWSWTRFVRRKAQGIVAPVIAAGLLGALGFLDWAAGAAQF